MMNEFFLEQTFFYNGNGVLLWKEYFSLFLLFYGCNQ